VVSLQRVFFDRPTEYRAHWDIEPTEAARARAGPF
jgi:hypothetical protein